MNKFIEVKAVLECINNGTENCVTEGMSDDLQELDAFWNLNELYCCNYSSLSDDEYSTNTAQETGRTVNVLDSAGQCFLEVHRFALYTENGKNFISRDDYMKFYPEE